MRKFEAQQLAQEKANELNIREIEAQHELKLREIESQERLKQDKLRLEEENWATERAEKESVVMLAKRYGDAMRASVTPLRPSIIDVVLFFRHIEAIFDRFKVPPHLQAALLMISLVLS